MLKSSRFQFKQVFGAFVAAVILFTAFQNCAKSDSGTGATVESSKVLVRNGNGDPYLKADGTYVNLDVEGKCGGASEEASVVVVENGKATMVKDQCHDILPVDVTTSSIAREHNTEGLFRGDKLYEKFENNYNGFSEILCSGSQAVPSNQEAFADVNLVKTQKMAMFNGALSVVYEGKIKTGVYENGSLKAKKAEYIPIVFKQVSPDGAKVVYKFTDARMTSSGVARMTQAPLSEYTLTVINGKTASFSFTYPLLGIEMELDSMTCYKH